MRCAVDNCTMFADPEPIFVSGRVVTPGIYRMVNDPGQVTLTPVDRIQDEGIRMQVRLCPRHRTGMMS